jgi:hypothetical protein
MAASISTVSTAVRQVEAVLTTGASSASTRGTQCPVQQELDFGQHVPIRLDD